MPSEDLIWGAGRMLIEELAELYVASRSQVVVDQGIRLRRVMKAIMKRWRGRDIEDIGQADFDRYAIEQLAAGLKELTVRQHLVHIRAALRFGARNGFRGPLCQLVLPASVPRRHDELTSEEAGRLLRHAPDIETRCFMAIALLTAARREAICDLTWDRVDLQARVLDFNMPHARSHRRVGRASVPITQVLADFLEAYRAFEPWQPGDRLCRWNAETFWKKVIEAGKRAGIPRRVTPNTLRHTAAIRMLRSVPTIYASRTLGHLSLAATEQTYAQSTAEGLRPSAQALNDLLVLQ